MWDKIAQAVADTTGSIMKGVSAKKDRAEYKRQFNDRILVFLKLYFQYF
jgi:hypothetical protein